MWRTRFRSRVWPAKLASGCGPWSAGTPRYRTDGYAGLKTAPRIDAGTHRLPGDLVQSIEGLALSKPRPTIATIHRKVTGICGIHGWPVPSYAVVWEIVRALDPGMVTLALEGAASYRDKHELVLRRQA